MRKNHDLDTHLNCVTFFRGTRSREQELMLANPGLKILNHQIVLVGEFQDQMMKKTDC